jgi:hypothetical protein
VADILVLLPEHYSREETRALLDRDGVRAAAFGDFGSGFGGIAMVQTASLSSGSDVGDLICPEGSIMDCINGILQPLPVVPSHHMPGEYNVFGIVTLYAGKQRAFKRHLLGMPDAVEGVNDARALVLGMEGVHALVEVVGDDLDAVTERLFELLDHDDVADVRTFVCGPDSTAGFGERMAARKSSGRKGTSSRKAR